MIIILLLIIFFGPNTGEKLNKKVYKKETILVVENILNFLNQKDTNYESLIK